MEIRHPSSWNRHNQPHQLHNTFLEHLRRADDPLITCQDIASLMSLAIGLTVFMHRGPYKLSHPVLED